jgi:hypothetical protein
MANQGLQVHTIVLTHAVTLYFKWLTSKITQQPLSVPDENEEGFGY